MFIRCATLCCSAVNHLGALNCFRLYFFQSYRVKIGSAGGSLQTSILVAFCCPAVSLCNPWPGETCVWQQLHLSWNHQSGQEVHINSCDRICLNTSQIVSKHPSWPHDLGRSKEATYVLPQGFSGRTGNRFRPHPTGRRCMWRVFLCSRMRIGVEHRMVS